MQVWGSGRRLKRLAMVLGILVAVVLIANDEQPSREALGAGGPGGGEAGQRGSDDRKRLHNLPLLIAVYAT